MPNVHTRACTLLRVGQADAIRMNAVITPDGGWYVARCVEVEVASQGETAESALANLREALELYFEDEPEGRPPTPGTSPRAGASAPP